MVSTKQAAPYYSPKADNFNQGVADLEVISQMEHSLEKLSGSWIGQLAQANHRLLLGIPKAKAITWFHALGNFPHSGVFLWPGKLHSIQTKHGPLRWFIHDEACESVVIQPLCSLEGVEACTFRWRSVLWQSINMPVAHRPKHPRLLPVIQEGPGPALVVVAREAFFSMTKTQVLDFAKLLPLATQPGDKLCDVLFAVVKKLCKCSDAEALALISKRLAVNDVSASFAEALLEIDEAAQVMDKADVKLLKQAQEKESDNRDEHADFASDFRDSMARHRAAQPAARSDRGRRQPIRDIPDRISQDEAKAMAPPGCYIWRGLRTQTWNGHCAPRRRISSSLLEMSDSQAMLNVLQRLWQQYLEFNGLGPEACPWTGLLDLSA